jgi:hypothetical protein
MILIDKATRGRSKSHRTSLKEIMAQEMRYAKTAANHHDEKGTSIHNNYMTLY